MYIISVRDKGADDSSESCGPPDPNGFGSVRQKAAMQEAGSHPVHLLAWHIGSDMRCRKPARTGMSPVSAYRLGYAMQEADPPGIIRWSTDGRFRHCRR